MLHPTNTRIVFAGSEEEARAKYLELGVKPKHEVADLECYKAIDEEDFDIDAEMNFIGEISVSPSIMADIRTDPERAYVLYYMEDSSSPERE